MSIDGEDSAYGRLRTAILSLELVPGERISERSLESLLGASRTPIRAALMRLENEGLTQREGRGWKVTPIDLAEVRAIMEYREAVEVAAVRLAVERADDEELAALLALAEAHRGCDDEETGLRDFSDFHLALVAPVAQPVPGRRHGRRADPAVPHPLAGRPHPAVPVRRQGRAPARSSPRSGPATPTPRSR